MALAESVFGCTGCSQGKTHRPGCSLGKKWSLVEPDLKPAYYQICAHEGVEKATAWLNQAKAKKAGRNDAMKDLAAALKKEEEATAKKAELHTLKGIKAAECKKHLENSPHAHLVKKAKFCASPAAYPHGDPCPECEKHGREGKIEQKVSKDGKPYAACSTFTPGAKKANLRLLQELDGMNDLAYNTGGWRNLLGGERVLAR